jgi:GPCR-chaperone
VIKYHFPGQEMVGSYQANFYDINGMILETRKRREHLSSDDLKKNKALLVKILKHCFFFTLLAWVLVKCNVFVYLQLNEIFLPKHNLNHFTIKGIISDHLEILFYFLSYKKE